MIHRSAILQEHLYARLRGGYVPPVSKSRSLLLAQYPHELDLRGITETELLTKSPRELAQILLQAQFDQFYAVPYHLFTFDLEFSDIPRFTDRGPTAAIIEFGMYHPDTDSYFHRWVQTESALVPDPQWSDQASELTGLTQAHISAKGTPFAQVWAHALTWMDTQIRIHDKKIAQRILQRQNMEPDRRILRMNPNSLDFSAPGMLSHEIHVPSDSAQRYYMSAPNDVTGVGDPFGSSDQVSSDSPLEASDTTDGVCPSSTQGHPASLSSRYLLLSHGGRIADVSMLRWYCRQVRQTPPEMMLFGDTYSVVRERHRRRPVTSDRLPAAWGLEDLAQWMQVPITDNAVSLIQNVYAQIPLDAGIQPRLVQPEEVLRNHPSRMRERGFRSQQEEPIQNPPRRASRNKVNQGPNTVQETQVDPKSHPIRFHRAVPDAWLTWRILEETLHRYGVEYLTPKQQLCELFFRPMAAESEITDR